jgi:hypothetical protein
MTCLLYGWFSFQTLKNIPNIIQNINNSTQKLVGITEKADQTLNYLSKTTGALVGSGGIAKGTVDVLESIACQDPLCTAVSLVGVCADGLSIATSFVVGPNITTVVTVPVSFGCKVFVYCCNLGVWAVKDKL